MSIDLTPEKNCKLYNVWKFISLFSLQAIVISCATTKNSTMDDFDFHEKIIVPYYQSPDDRKKALRKLSRNCTWQKNALSCYNLSILYSRENNFSDAYAAAVKSVRIDPRDSLYASNLFHAAKKAQKTGELKNKFPDLYAQGSEVDKCDTPCNTTEKKQKNYADTYYSEKEKKNEFSAIWDISGYVKNSGMPAAGNLSTELSTHWRDFLNAVKGHNKTEAEKSFQKFKTELDKKKDPLREAIRLAAKLLLEQEILFRNYRYLAREL